LADLLERIVREDVAAFAEFYDQTKQMLTSCVARIVRDRWDAEEVLQDTYQQVWLRAGAFRSDRGVPSAWIRTIARSRALDNLRRGKRKQSEVLLDEQRCFTSPESIELELSERSSHAQILQTVQRLPSSQKQIIDLAFFEGFSHSQVAATTGLPLGTVKSRIRIALTMLREELPQRPG
jgi:RNA polymerase sigma-70 factor, ECF subfamily